MAACNGQKCPAWIASALQGFDECTTVGATFKLFESFEGLVERDAISADLERKHAELVRSFLFELHEASWKTRDGWTTVMDSSSLQCRLGLSP